MTVYEDDLKSEFADLSSEIAHVLALTDNLSIYAADAKILPGIYAGFDPAKTTDRSAFVVLEKPLPTLEEPSPKLRCRLMRDLSIDEHGHKGLGHLRQGKRIIEYDQRFKITRLCVDATNEKSVVEYLEDYFGPRVEGVKFSLPLKKEMITTTRVVFQEKLIQFNSLLTNYSILRKELYELVPDTLKHPDGGSDDFAWALALAIKAAKVARYEANVESGEANDVPLIF